MSNRFSNEQWRTHALEAKDRGDFRRAMRCFNSAAARTTGHGKSGRYEEAAERCAELGNFEYKWDFAKEEEYDE